MMDDFDDHGQTGAQDSHDLGQIDGDDFHDLGADDSDDHEQIDGDDSDDLGADDFDDLGADDSDDLGGAVEYPPPITPVRAFLTRLKNLAFHPLWTESHLQKTRRRGQFVLIMPFILLGGMIWGWFAAPTIGEGSRLLWSTLGASSFGLFFYLEQKLLPVVASLADRIGLGALAALAWEVGVVGGLIFVFTSVLGAPVVPAVALAIGVGVLYSFATEYLVFGSAADHIANFLGLGSGWSGPRELDFSHAEALEKRGNLEAAAEIYKEAMWRNRRDPQAYLRLAALRTRDGLHEEAIDILRKALRVARFSGWKEAFAVREIHEISSSRLGDSARAAPDLARYLERRPEGVHEEWARRELAAIKERIREES